MKKCSRIKINHVFGRHIINPTPLCMLRFAYALYTFIALNYLIPCLLDMKSNLLTIESHNYYSDTRYEILIRGYLITLYLVKDHYICYNFIDFSISQMMKFPTKV